MTYQTARQKLAKEATIIKKAWLLCVASKGNDFIQKAIRPEDRSIPDYETYKPGHLRSHIKNLQNDLKGILNGLAETRANHSLITVADWLSDRYDAWRASDPGMFTISTVLEFEANVGRLRARKFMEVPLYGEIYLQPIGTTIRHPEYCLVRDLGMLWEFYLDAYRVRRIAERRRYQKCGLSAGENEQSLARSTVISCFNLLESFVSGIAREHLMTHPDVSTDLRKKLEDTHKPLRSRLKAIASLTAGKDSSLDESKPPLAVVFDPVKSHRDTFVHCEPGPQLSERGYRKEGLFHDVPKELVENAVRNTFEIIRITWKDVYGREGPRWLPEWSVGRFGNANLRLCPEEWSDSA
jgi:hypothetical protein